MEKSKKKIILCLMIFAAAIPIYILNMDITSKSSVVSEMTELRVKLADASVLKGNVSEELRIEKNDKVSCLEVKKADLKSQKRKRFPSNRRTESSRVLQGIQLTSGDNGSEWMNDVTIEGRINPSRNYAVFSVTTDNNSEDYMFYLPLTTLAWKRIGFNSVILAVGSSNKSISDPSIRYVLSKCLELDAVVIHIYSPTANAVTISQVGRLFAANILSAAFAEIELVYLLTSDADLWPIHADIYRLRSDMAVLSLNSDCCSSFLHRGLNYKMLPMSNIGMRVMTWNKLTEKDCILPTSSQEILSFLFREFGEVAVQPVFKGENKGWYLDQMTISIMMKNWTEQYGSNHVMLIPRNTANDRIDRSHWNGESSLDGKIDAHMPLQAFSPDIWKGITPLLKSMYGYNSERYNWSIEYFESYRRHRSH